MPRQTQAKMIEACAISRHPWSATDLHDSEDLDDDALGHAEEISLASGALRLVEHGEGAELSEVVRDGELSACDGSDGSAEADRRY